MKELIAELEALWDLNFDDPTVVGRALTLLAAATIEANQEFAETYGECLSEIDRLVADRIRLVGLK